MTDQEANNLDEALKNMRFSEYEIKIILAIFSGEGNLAQENILRTTDEGNRLLRKLGWYRRVKSAIQQSSLNLLDNNQIRI